MAGVVLEKRPRLELRSLTDHTVPLEDQRLTRAVDREPLSRSGWSPSGRFHYGLVMK